MSAENYDKPLEYKVGAEDLHRQFFGKVGIERARTVLGALLDSPFLYRVDDPDLFGVLQRNRAIFKDFFEVCFGWDLYVDHSMARVIRRQAGIKSLQSEYRHVFELDGRDEQITFVLLLEFQEMEADRQGFDWAEADSLRFLLSDFVVFLFARFRDAGPFDGKAEARVLAATKELFRKLNHYRFLRRVGGVRGESDFEGDAPAEAVYECLPGLRCYRAEAVEASGLLAEPVLQPPPEFATDPLPSEEPK